MPRPNEQANVRIVAHAMNLTTEEREMIDKTCKKRGILHSDITGVCFIDGHKLLVLSLKDGTAKVQDIEQLK